MNHQKSKKPKIQKFKTRKIQNLKIRGDFMNVYNSNEKPAYLVPTLTVQQYLRRISQFYPVSLIIDDGIYGEETAAAVTEFQELADLPATGEVNLPTWQMLLSVHQNIEKNYGTATTIQPIKSMDDNFDQEILIYFIQTMVKSLSKTYANIEKVAISGIFDQQTSNQLLKIQTIAQIPATGNLDLPTWNALVALYNKGNA